MKEFNEVMKTLRKQHTLRNIATTIIVAKIPKERTEGFIVDVLNSELSKNEELRESFSYAAYTKAVREVSEIIRESDEVKAAYEFLKKTE